MSLLIPLALALASSSSVTIVTVEELDIPLEEVAARAAEVLSARGQRASVVERLRPAERERISLDAARADDLYIEGKLDEAVARIVEVLALIDGSALHEEEILAVAQDLRLKIAKWTLTSDEARARSALAEVVQRAPDFVLDEARYPPKFRALFDEVRREVLGRPSGALALKSMPPGAKVFVDGRALGETPLTLSTLPAGQHIVWLERDGRRTPARKVLVEGTASVEMDLLLEWFRGRERGAPPGNIDDAGFARLAKNTDADDVLLLSHQKDSEGRIWLIGAYWTQEVQRAGAVEVVGGSGDIARLVEALASGDEIEEGPQPEWLLPPPVDVLPADTATEGGGSWVWIAAGIGAGVAIAAAGTLVGVALVPPSSGSFNVQVLR